MTIDLKASLGTGARVTPRWIGMRVGGEPQQQPKNCDSRQVEIVFRFVCWAHRTRQFPNATQICDRFGVSRATAFRWRESLAAAMGIALPPDTSRDEAGEIRS
ncbi:hypothetical protein [Lysobacter antibioticus]|uniref:hypothetical protein n=1 Tax=Lysobacter antibioticus TaxID=84531 RepID=UPI00113FEC5E|nr:hypothetical protein [Lysobacter antibioticus]